MVDKVLYTLLVPLGVLLMLCALGILLVPPITGESIFGYNAVINDVAYGPTIRYMTTGFWAIALFVSGYKLFRQRYNSPLWAGLSLIAYMVMLGFNSHGSLPVYQTLSGFWTGILVLILIPAFQLVTVSTRFLRVRFLVPGRAK